MSKVDICFQEVFLIQHSSNSVLEDFPNVLKLFHDRGYLQVLFQPLFTQQDLPCSLYY